LLAIGSLQATTPPQAIVKIWMEVFLVLTNQNPCGLVLTKLETTGQIILVILAKMFTQTIFHVIINTIGGMTEIHATLRNSGTIMRVRDNPWLMAGYTLIPQF